MVGPGMRGPRDGDDFESDSFERRETRWAVGKQVLTTGGRRLPVDKHWKPNSRETVTGIGRLRRVAYLDSLEGQGEGRGLSF